MNWKTFAALALSVSLLGGCSLVERLVYRIDINQGNYLDEKDIDNLRYGMNQEQVRYVLGSPMLVEPEYPNTWYYVFYHKPGHHDPEQKNLILKFDANRQLISMSGDYQTGTNFNKPLN